MDRLRTCVVLPWVIAVSGFPIGLWGLVPSRDALTAGT